MIAIKVAVVPVLRKRRKKMGFSKPMDYNAVNHQIYMAGVEMRSPYNDGYTQWEIKKDLHKLKWLLDEIMRTAPTFVGEDEFLEEHAKEQTVRILKR
jgi:vancomycin permeability regulator SanA